MRGMKDLKECLRAPRLAASQAQDSGKEKGLGGRVVPLITQGCLGFAKWGKWKVLRTSQGQAQPGPSYADRRGMEVLHPLEGTRWGRTSLLHPKTTVLCRGWFSWTMGGGEIVSFKEPQLPSRDFEIWPAVSHFRDLGDSNGVIF
jgi:hypothetical protein